MKLGSPAFDHLGELPDRHRYDEGEHSDTTSGQNIRPELQFKNIPADTKSLAIVVRDIDTPNKQMIHWLIWNINPSRTVIAEDETPQEATVGKNSYTSNEYKGPNPAQGKNEIWFDLYALQTKLSLDGDTDYEDFQNAIEGKVIDQARLVATCQRTGEFALE